jgi:hypothetical protein
MGRQIHFHMLPNDRDEFLRFVQQADPIAFISKYGESSSVVPLPIDAIDKEQSIYFWNRSFLPNLERKWVPDPGFYGLSNLNEPILEFRPSSALVTWEEKRALVQGRLYGIFDPYLGKPPEFQKWYERLVRWIQKTYKKNPTSMSGYVGPAAYEFFEEGGYLLPQYLPVRTQAWLDEIAKQHQSPAQVRKRTGT